MIGAVSDPQPLVADLARRPLAWKFGPLLVALVSFGLFYPTLHWLEFNNSIENIVVETALETRRDGNWLLPRMMGEMRTRKPPMAAWLAALAIRPATLAALDDPATRQAAYEQLASQIRLPALIATCLMLAATYELGRLIGGGFFGICAAAVAGTNFLTFNAGQFSTPDTHLALWVTAANVFLFRAIFRDQRWLGCIGGGISLGLAFMSKGPVALIFGVVPAAIYFAVQKRFTIQPDGPPAKSPPPPWRAPLAVGIACFLGVALPWYVLLWLRVPDVWRTWFNEVTRLDPADPRPDPIHASLRFFGLMFPWTPWLVAATVEGIIHLRQKRLDRRLALALLMMWAPFLVLACFPERKPRYVQPLVVAAGILAAWAIASYQRGPNPDRRLEAAHWISVGAMWVGTPLVLAFFWPTDRGQRWFSPLAGVLAAVAGAALLMAGIRLSRRNSRVLVWVSLAGMMLLAPMFRLGYRNDPSGRADLKPLADAIVATAPAAPVYYIQSSRATSPVDLSIYLNRVVATLPSPADVPPSAARPVIVLSQSADDVANQPGPDWRQISEASRGKTRWLAFVRR